MVKRIRIKNGKIPNIDSNVSCIGYFDGVHIGHQELLKETIKQANLLNVKSCVICFEPDPMNVITNTKSNHLLNFKDRLMLLESFGIDEIIIIKFDSDLMKISPIQFINKYLNVMNIKKLICGFDFTFGYRGLGNIKLLYKHFKNELIVIEECKYYGKKISSTRIKQALFEGKIRLVNKLLGYEYYLYLEVVNCSRKKNKWLIEAKLIDDSCILPKNISFNKNLYIKNSKVFIKGNKRLDIGSSMFLQFSNYE